VEAIVALPTDMFYNTGIPTYIWILDNNKTNERKGKVQLVEASQFFERMRKNLGSKRKEISPQNLQDIVGAYAAFEETDISKILKTTEFGYRQITVETPLRLAFKVDEPAIEKALANKAVVRLDETDQIRLITALKSIQLEIKSRSSFAKELNDACAQQGVVLSPPTLKALINEFGFQSQGAEICKDSKGIIEADPDSKDIENIALDEDVEGYFSREVKPFAPDAWINSAKEKVGYEIPFTRLFYKYTQPRALSVIDEELNNLVIDIQALLRKIE
jgi:type I restriction enzyme M protein